STLVRREVTGPTSASTPMSPEIQQRLPHSAAADRRDATAGSRPLIRCTCWGTRGSIPSPGPATTGFGGNTPCIAVRTAAGDCLIFDAGTGIRELGRRLAAAGRPVRADIFLSHFHWDHIQGLPFFAPLYDANTSIRIHGARQDGI